MESYPAMRNPAICNKWMDLEVIVLSGVTQTEKDKCGIIALICGT